MVLKPGVRSLFQILSSMKIKVENVVENVDGLEKLLRRARKNLVLREEKSKASIQTAFIEPQKPIKEHKKVTISDVIPRSPKHFHRSKAESSLLSVVKLLKDGPAPSLNKSFSCGSIDTNSSSSSLSLTESIETPESMSPQYGSTGDLSDSASPRVMSPVVSLKFGLKWKHSNEEAKNTFKRKNPKTIKNAVYCVIVLEEWLKELAAISQEHALWQMEDYEMTT
ncbi:hypothetical protein QZH41_008938 [Actinostola sp. cb2023]|nr:hypothetical protein QZH41_008938 [Actinostola sp. cb2023]